MVTGVIASGALAPAGGPSCDEVQGVENLIGGTIAIRCLQLLAPCRGRSVTNVSPIGPAESG